MKSTNNSKTRYIESLYLENKDLLKHVFYSDSENDIINGVFDMLTNGCCYISDLISITNSVRKLSSLFDIQLDTSVMPMAGLTRNICNVGYNRDPFNIIRAIEDINNRVLNGDKK